MFLHGNDDFQSPHVRTTYPQLRLSHHDGPRPMTLRHTIRSYSVLHFSHWSARPRSLKPQVKFLSHFVEKFDLRHVWMDSPPALSCCHLQLQYIVTHHDRSIMWSQRRGQVLVNPGEILFDNIFIELISEVFVQKNKESVRHIRHPDTPLFALSGAVVAFGSLSTS